MIIFDLASFRAVVSFATLIRNKGVTLAAPKQSTINNVV